AVWGVVALLICLALWPALWVDPVGSIQTIINEAAGNGGQAHPDGSFFLGQAVGDPGWLFYPAALVLRLTPWALLGVLALAWPTRERQHRVLVALLVVAVLAFLLLLSIPPKKFDRYILPVFPLLDILAAVGIVRLWSAGMRWWGRGVSMLVPGAVYGLVLAALAFNMLWYHPYQLAYFNPLLGGGPVAARTITVGWGEGLEQAGAYITAQPDGCAYPLAAWYEETILPYVCTAVMNLGWANDPATVNYAVLYINQVQRGIYADITAMLPERAALVQQVTIHGVPYAWVYQLPRPLPMQAKAQFGDVLRLHSYGIDITNIRTGWGASGDNPMAGPHARQHRLYAVFAFARCRGHPHCSGRCAAGWPARAYQSVATAPLPDLGHTRCRWGPTCRRVATGWRLVCIIRRTLPACRWQAQAQRNQTRPTMARERCCCPWR
ncbi:MAG: hypothetical protein HC893_13220, partial [Chloroflexaceae bacterium]|nr:hypothetical protein [Chloroflexaceae bacterium]